MLIRSSDAMQGIGFAAMLPLSFLAGTFVPIAGMKLIPRVIAWCVPLIAVCVPLALRRFRTAGA